MEALVRQARIDLAAFSADDPDAGAGAYLQRNAEVALAQATVALRYNPDSGAPLVQELRALCAAVALLISGTRESASVA